MKKLPLPLLALWLTASTCYGEVFTVNVHSTMDLSQAGRTSVNLPYPEPNGYNHTELPVSIALPANARTVQFPLVFGVANPGPFPVQAYPGWPWVGADGGPDPAGLTTFINSWNGISGIKGSTYLALMGVFVGPDGTGVNSTLANPGRDPGIYDFTPGLDFPSSAPALDRSFVIGDGRTWSGALQDFLVPSGAAYLCLGFLDCDTFGWYNKNLFPSAYWDNFGSYTVTGDVSVSVAEPSTLSLVSLGMFGLLLYSRYRRAR